MKRNLQIFLTATTASLLTLPVIAQEKTTPRSDRPGYARDGMTPMSSVRDGMTAANSSRLHSAVKASDLIGMTVNNHQDEKLGTVEDLAVDLESGRIVQVILSTGGFVGMGERLSAVPPGALSHDATDNVLQLDATKEKLKSAPEFKTEQWTQHSDLDHLSAVYTHYGQETAFTFVDKGEATNPKSSRNADGTWKGTRPMGASQGMIPTARLGQTEPASKLMGRSVKNQQAESLGEVEDMLVDVQSGRVIAVVVSSGGFLGMGDELSAIPPAALGFDAGRDTLQLDMSKEKLSAAPHFKSDQWPDFNQSDYSASVYRAYQMEPYFTASGATRADNTARNERDRNDRTITPLDQGNSKADIETTAEIRKGILAGQDMSVNARNVKIITNNGQVTLRGPVKSQEEKRMIGEIANRIAQSGNVDNQLEVTLEGTRN